MFFISCVFQKEITNYPDPVACECSYATRHVLCGGAGGGTPAPLSRGGIYTVTAWGGCVTVLRAGGQRFIAVIIAQDTYVIFHLIHLPTFSFTMFWMQCLLTTFHFLCADCLFSKYTWLFAGWFGYCLVVFSGLSLKRNRCRPLSDMRRLMKGWRRAVRAANG